MELLEKKEDGRKRECTECTKGFRAVVEGLSGMEGLVRIGEEEAGWSAFRVSTSYCISVSTYSQVIFIGDSDSNDLHARNSDKNIGNVPSVPEFRWDRLRRPFIKQRNAPQL